MDDVKRTFAFLLLFTLMVLYACKEEKRTAEQEAPEEKNKLAEPTQPVRQKEKDRTAYTNLDWLDEGNKVVSAAFASLSSHLKAAVEKGGVQEAVQYCHLNAYPLVDSLSKAHEALIRRTSLKVRNPKNLPDRLEERALHRVKQMLAEGKTVEPWVEYYPEDVAYYAPIYVQGVCLKCHGTPGKTISSQDYAFIKERYPEDEATGYKEGDWRGLWSIRFARK